jgi:hypothetical protein
VTDPTAPTPTTEEDTTPSPETSSMQAVAALMSLKHATPVDVGNLARTVAGQLTSMHQAHPEDALPAVHTVALILDACADCLSPRGASEEQLKGAVTIPCPPRLPEFPPDEDQ